VAAAAAWAVCDLFGERFRHHLGDRFPTAET
jgi:hypothetical protein